MSKPLFYEEKISPSNLRPCPCIEYHLENPRTDGFPVEQALFLNTSILDDAEMDFCFSLYLSTQGEREPFLIEYTTLLVSCFLGDSRGSESFGIVIGSDRKLQFVVVRESTAPSWQGWVLGFGTSSSKITSC